MPTRVVHVDREPYDVYIGRRNERRGLPESVWHNPYREGRDGTRAEVIAKFRAYLMGRPDLLARLPELRGKVLGCYCRPRHACHGDVLAELADAGP
jgi:hypothetical protein